MCVCVCVCVLDEDKEHVRVKPMLPFIGETKWFVSKDKLYSSPAAASCQRAVGGKEMLHPTFLLTFCLLLFNKKGHTKENVFEGVVPLKVICANRCLDTGFPVNVDLLPSGLSRR